MSGSAGRSPSWTPSDLKRLSWDKLVSLVFDIAKDNERCWPLIEAALTEMNRAPKDEYFVGECPAMQKIFSDIRRFAPTDLTVLILGESGTGKELVARALHERAGRRASGPFVAINCAALTPTLIGSELFGHEKGAFTGAISRRIGLLEQANTGTIFLDEIGDLPLDQQGHFLRFLENKTITRTGGNKEIPVDVRVLAATHIDLSSKVQNGTFRQDLFYRLQSLRIDIAPLRDRGSDILLLARYFLQENVREFGRHSKRFSPDAERALLMWHWPGNVRELLSVVRRAVVMSAGTVIEAEDLGLNQRTHHTETSVELSRSSSKEKDSRNGRLKSDHAVNAVQVPSKGVSNQAEILEALTRARGRHSDAAKLLGMSRATLFRRLKEIRANDLKHSIAEAPSQEGGSRFRVSKGER